MDEFDTYTLTIARRQKDNKAPEVLIMLCDSQGRMNNAVMTHEAWEEKGELFRLMFCELLKRRSL